MTACSNLGSNNGWRPNAAVVRRDALGPASAEETTKLRAPEHLDEWREILAELIQETQNEITDSRTKVALTRDNRGEHKSAIKTHAIIASRAMHVRQMYEARLRECKRLQRKRDVGSDAVSRMALEARVQRLEDLVLRLTSGAS
jgi:hypothetical protein